MGGAVDWSLSNRPAKNAERILDESVVAWVDGLFKDYISGGGIFYFF